MLEIDSPISGIIDNQFVAHGELIKFGDDLFSIRVNSEKESETIQIVSDLRYPINVNEDLSNERKIEPIPKTLENIKKESKDMEKKEIVLSYEKKDEFSSFYG